MLIIITLFAFQLCPGILNDEWETKHWEKQISAQSYRVSFLTFSILAKFTVFQLQLDIEIINSEPAVVLFVKLHYDYSSIFIL